MRPTRESRPRAILTSGLGGAIVGTGGTSTDEGDHVLVIEGGRDQGYSLGDLGATESIDPTNGNVQYGTLDDDCTITLLAPDTTRVNGVTTIELYLTEDGTGGWEPTWAASGGSIHWPDGVTPTHDTTADTLTRYIFETVDDGANWYGNVIGGGSSVGALDDLTDVTITSPQEDDDLRYNGSLWVNDARKWEAVTNGEDVFVWEGDDLVHDWNA